MRRVTLLILTLGGLSALSTNALAEGWCNVQSGYSLITHGNKGDELYILGRLVGQSGEIWIELGGGSTGKANAAVVLAAQVSGKDIQVFLDLASDTCTTFPSWAGLGRVRHVRIVP
jgi:hypothetical protein